MELAFYIAGAVSVISTVLMLTRLNVVHALLYLIVSLLAVAVVFYVLGAPFVAALEVIIYAGAIMVLFVFVVMMLNLGEHGAEMEKQWLTPGIWTGPASGLHPPHRGCLLVRASCGPGHRSGGTEGSGDSSVRSLSNWRGTYVHAFAGRSSGRLSPGLPQTEKLEIRLEIQHDADTHERRAAASGDLVLAGTDQPARTP
jgi:hypothetical protein